MSTIASMPCYSHSSQPTRWSGASTETKQPQHWATTSLGMGRPSIHPSIHPSSKVCIEFSEDSSFIGATDEEEVCRRWQSERWLSLGGEGWSWKFSRSQDNRHNAHVTHAETCRGIVGAVECSNNQPYNLLDSQNIITHIVIPLQSYCNLNTTFRRLAMSPTCCKVMTNPLPVAYSTPAKWYYIINPTMSERIPWCGWHSKY